MHIEAVSRYLEGPGPLRGPAASLEIKVVRFHRARSRCEGTAIRCGNNRAIEGGMK